MIIKVKMFKFVFNDLCFKRLLLLKFITVYLCIHIVNTVIPFYKNKRLIIVWDFILKICVYLLLEKGKPKTNSI